MSKPKVRHRLLISLAQTKEDKRRWEIAESLQREIDARDALYAKTLAEYQDVIKRVQSMIPDMDILTLGSEDEDGK